MTLLEDVFRPIYGKPCWQFRQGFGSFLTLEFGEPHLHIREPRPISADASARRRNLAARRLVHLHGDWHLWIYLCDWRIFLRDQLKADNTSKRSVIRRVTSELDGQALTRVTVDQSWKTVFEFDLGGRLETYPEAERYYGAEAELWLFYEPSERVFVLRTDGRYRHESGEVASGEDDWLLL